MTKLYFRSGLRSIGGTIIELVDGEHRLVFDFGTAFSGANREEINPEVDGIYDNTSKYNDMVLISHLHLDHTKAMNLVSPEIPLVMNTKSVEMIDQLYSIDFKGFNGERREYTAIDYDQVIEHGNFKITCLKVDHNVPGACAFLIQSQDLTLLYSGDLRLHGRDADVMPKFFEKLKTLVPKIDVYITEGVSVSFIDENYQLIASSEISEIDNESNFAKCVIDTINNEPIIYANPYIMDMERIESLFELANVLKREMVLTSHFAKVVSSIYPNYQFKIIGEDIYNVGCETIAYQEVDETMIVLFDYQKASEYPKALNGAAMLQIGGEPLGDFDYRWQEYMNYLEQQNYTLYKVGSGGHASPENLLYIAEEVSATYTMPLHSFKPELLNSDNINQLMPVENYEYIFSNHNLLD